MYKPLLLALTLLSTAPLAHAQVRLSVGPQVGYTLSSANYKLSNIDFDNRYRSGFSGGLTAELGVGHLLVRPAVLYAQKGYSQAYSNNGSFGVNFTITSRTRIDYLAVPLNIGYAQRTDGQGFQVFAGAYLGFVLGGHYNTETQRSSVSAPGTITETSTGPIVRDGDVTNGNGRVVRSTDVGVQGGIGYRYQNLLAQAEYSMGLKNIEPNSVNVVSSASYHNRVFQLSLAYLFGPKL
jgi:hypothetical protein